MNVVKSFSYKEEKEGVMSELSVIAARERKKTSELIVEIIEEFVKQHSEGNTTFTLEQFQDPEFQAMPTFMSDKWVEYYKNSNDKDKTKYRIQAMNLTKKFRMVDINT